MNKWGIHLPNGDIQDDRLFSSGFSHFTLLHHQDKYIPRLREESPDGIILVRFYFPKWSDISPSVWGAMCAQIYQNHEYKKYRVHVTPANEMNLPDEGGGWTAENYRQIDWWLYTWLDSFLNFSDCPLDATHWPALANGHSDDQDDFGYVGMNICRPSIQRYHYLDVHPYWQEPQQVQDPYYGARYKLAHDLFPSKPIFLSEAGNFHVDRDSTPDEIVSWFQSLYDYPYIIGATPFIWEDPTKAHQVNDWSRNERLVRRVQSIYKALVVPGSDNVPPIPIPPPGGHPSPSSDILASLPPDNGLRRVLETNTWLGKPIWYDWWHGVREMIYTDKGYYMDAYKDSHPQWRILVYDTNHDRIYKAVNTQLWLLET